MDKNMDVPVHMKTNGLRKIQRNEKEISEIKYVHINK